ncbi:MAG: alpha/beta hydrolase, partial [Oscillospiraceae bacterium]|nr:alpha/beta hydrolase [Oscillospiraceae bacterium]
MKQKALFLLGVLTALLSLFGCSGADSAPPSKIPYPTEMPALDPKADIYAQDLAGEDLLRGNEIFSQQFRIPATVSAESLTAENRLALSKDGTYRLVKAMTGTETENFSLVFDFSGTYTDGGDGAFTLSPADSVTAYIDWGAFDASRPGASGVFTGADSLAYSRAFNSQYIGDDAGNNEMYVQINAQEKTFEITGNGSQQDRYTVTNLNTERDGLNIYGVSVLPAGYTEGKLPVVIFSHGFLGNNTIQRDIAYAFAERGIASYCFDFCGGSMTSKSDGSFYDLSMLTEVEDLHAV